MKTALSFLSLLLLASALLLAGDKPDDAETCEFTLSGEPTQPTITGPDDIVPRVRILAQPDSPIELLAVDFEGTFLWLRNDEFTWEPRCKIKIRNRSDQLVEDFSVSVHLHSSGGGVGGSAWLSRLS
ncbi:MAG: hypothetical protein ACE5IP_05485 [Terriglobia bacterium]